MKLTFALLKPHISQTPQEKEVLKDIKAAGFLIANKKVIKKPALHIVATHFEELRVKIPEAFDRNVKTFCEGPVTILRIYHPHPEVDPITELRKLAGPTDPSKASKKTLRGKYGDDTIRAATREKRGLRNVIHCSDSPTSASEEFMLWFHGKTSTIPKHSFHLEDNHGGDQLNIQFLSKDQVLVKLAQCCVPRVEAEVPVSILIDLLIRWQDGDLETTWEEHSTVWPKLKSRIKIAGKPLE